MKKDGLPWLPVLLVGVGLAVLAIVFPMNADSKTSPESGKDKDKDAKTTLKGDPDAKSGETALATFGGGCFWCTEAVYEKVEGVQTVISGYSGGKTKNPTYKQITTGTTGHAEVIQIKYEPAKVSYEELLEIFWLAHDPTTLNRQGNDVGTQYRSVIYYHDDAQKTAAVKAKQEAAPMFKRPIVTEISPMGTFYVAEDYHQDYFENNPNNPYCNFFIPPKLNKLKKAGKIK